MISPSAHPILSVRDLVVQFGTDRVINKISFDIEKGAMVAIICPNGSGKTTLIRAILGLEKADQPGRHRRSALVVRSVVRHSAAQKLAPHGNYELT